MALVKRSIVYRNGLSKRNSLFDFGDLSLLMVVIFCLTRRISIDLPFLSCRLVGSRLYRTSLCKPV